MAYPQIPTNSLEIYEGNGKWINLYTLHNMILLDGYDLGLPTVKSYVVDIPGGDGSLDITETVYGNIPLTNRQQSFNFIVVDLEDQQAFETKKSEILKQLHGYAFKYRLTIDKSYYYEGRFNFDIPSFASTSNHGFVGFFSVSVNAKPYKTKTSKGKIQDVCIGGKTLSLENGRKRVLPKIQLPAESYISFEDKEWTLGPGTFTINDLILKEGTNEIYVDSYPLNIARWNDLFRLNTSKYRPDGYENMHKHIVYTNNQAVLNHLNSEEFEKYLCSRLSTPIVNGNSITHTTEGNYVGVFYSDNVTTWDSLIKYVDLSRFRWSINNSNNQHSDELLEIVGPTWEDLESCTFDQLCSLSGAVKDYRTTWTTWTLLTGSTWESLKESTWDDLSKVNGFTTNIYQTPVIVEWEVGEI